VPRERTEEGIAEAEKAEASLRIGLVRSKRLLAQYRARLSMLRRVAMMIERPVLPSKASS
jgi:hypothetical protein